MAVINQITIPNDQTYDIEDKEAARKSVEATFTLTAANWTTTTQTISLSGVKADTKGVFALQPSVTVEQYEAAALARLRLTQQAEGSVTIGYFGVKPTVNIPCVITILG